MPDQARPHYLANRRISEEEDLGSGDVQDEQPGWGKRAPQVEERIEDLEGRLEERNV